MVTAKTGQPTHPANWPRASIWTSPTWRNRPNIAVAPVLMLVAVLLFLWKAFDFGMFSSPVDNFLVSWTCLLAIGGLGLLLFRWTYNLGKPRFLPEPILEDEEVNVSLHLFLNYIGVGRDQGILGLDGDTFFFVGSGCSFVLGAQDIKFFYQYEEGFIRGAGRGTGGWLMQVWHPQGLLELKFSIIGDAVHPAGLPNRLHDLIKANRPTELPRSFPPIHLPPVTFAGEREKVQALWSRDSRRK